MWHLFVVNQRRLNTFKPPPTTPSTSKFQLPSPNPLSDRLNTHTPSWTPHVAYALTLDSSHHCRLLFWKGINTFLSLCQVRGAAGDTSSKEAIGRRWNGPTMHIPMLLLLLLLMLLLLPMGRSSFSWSALDLLLLETCGEGVSENVAYPWRQTLWTVELCYTRALQDENLLSAKLWACEGTKERSCCGTITEMCELQLYDTSLQTLWGGTQTRTRMQRCCSKHGLERCHHLNLYRLQEAATSPCCTRSVTAIWEQNAWNESGSLGPNCDLSPLSENRMHEMSQTVCDKIAELASDDMREVDTGKWTKPESGHFSRHYKQHLWDTDLQKNRNANRPADNHLSHRNKNWTELLKVSIRSKRNVSERSSVEKQRGQNCHLSRLTCGMHCKHWQI